MITLSAMSLPLPALAQIFDSRAEAVMVSPGGALTPLPSPAPAPAPLPAPYETAARQALARASDHGLAGFDPTAAGPERLAELVVAYARAQHGQRLTPATFHEAWGMRPAPYDAVQDYNAAVASGRFDAWLATLPPPDPRYEALRQAYVALKAEAPSPERAAQLRRIEANLERWRWAPRDLPPERIEVNIPESRLALLEDGRPAMAMRAAVGKSAKDMWTPILATEISAVVLNPPWNIPDDIFDNEIAPKLKGDPAAFARRGLVVRPAGEEGTRVYQRHSPTSALGQVKLDMPNDYGVYLHDTPGKGVFAKEARSITHGCIRLEGAVPLAKRLLAKENAATPDEIARVLAGNDTSTVPLPRPEPVYLFYWTTRIENGQLSFAEDIYGWDRELNAKLTAAR
jgi:murein L,D-transpeptidase YcbB/YkuD